MGSVDVFEKGVVRRSGAERRTDRDEGWEQRDEVRGVVVRWGRGSEQRKSVITGFQLVIPVT